MHGYERFGITMARALKYVTRKYTPYTARKIAAVISAVALKLKLPNEVFYRLHGADGMRDCYDQRKCETNDHLFEERS